MHHSASSPPAPGEVEVLVVGASARAACFSAARAGLAPYWVDQFGDADLRAAFPGAVVVANDYPSGILAALASAPPAPVMYTGALENHGALLTRIAERHVLLGHDAATCRAVRDPGRLAACLAAHDISFPRTLGPGITAPAGHWLHKPLRSGGGFGIRTATPGERAAPGHVLQAFLPGDAHAAVYAAGAGGVRLLGVTRQLVGRPEFNAPAFSYCGSLGPVALPPAQTAQWERIGVTLAREFGLRGLFGIDGVVEDARVTVIEVNPRYTASVEVLEIATGVQAVALHGLAFGLRATEPSNDAGVTAPGATVAGKAILFAPDDLEFNPAVTEVLDDAVTFADVPAPGTPVARGAPLLSLLCRGATAAACEAALLRKAAAVYRGLL